MGVWDARAEESAKDAILYLIDDIVARLSHDEAATEIFEYSSDYHFSSHVDRSYTLRDAVDLLEDLSQFEETDSGLWHDQAPKRAISIMAAYTYGNAVASYFSEWMEKIRNAVNVEIDEEEWENWSHERILDYIHKLIRHEIRGEPHPRDEPKGGPARRWKLEDR